MSEEPTTNNPQIPTGTGTAILVEDFTAEELKDLGSSPRCVEIKRNGKRCKRPVFSQKYQLCRTCYGLASNAGTLKSHAMYRTKRKKGNKEKRIKRRKTQGSLPDVPQYIHPDATPMDDSKESTATDKPPTTVELESEYDGILNAPLVYGKFDNKGGNFARWELVFLNRRRDELSHFFDRPESSGLAHRMILLELQSERLRRRAEAYTLIDDVGKTEKVMQLVERMEKTIRDLQKELLFLPRDIQDEYRTEEVFTELQNKFQQYKAQYAVEFDREQIELMSKKKMDVKFEKTRLAHLTTRFSKECARELSKVLLSNVFNSIRVSLELTPERMDDLIEKVLYQLRAAVPEMKEYID